MNLEGMHHLTMITGDAQRVIDFYADTLGLRLVKQTVNFDAPEAYHLYFGDEHGSPGSILTWFEFQGAVAGRAGAGMVHTIQLGVESEAALDFWATRLSEHGTDAVRDAAGPLRFSDPDGLALELLVVDGAAPRCAEHPEVPAEYALRGVAGARAFSGRGPAADEALLTETLGFERLAEGEYRIGDGFRWGYDASEVRGLQGAGTVHHIAWHSRDEDHVAWQHRVAEAGMHVTPVIDRDYFLSIYFRQPQGILFEIATTSPGFAVDEPPEHLGESLQLPAQHEHLRPALERILTPLRNPRVGART